jgi:hypothetical protein
MKLLNYSITPEELFSCNMSRFRNRPMQFYIKDRKNLLLIMFSFFYSFTFLSTTWFQVNSHSIFLTQFLKLIEFNHVFNTVINGVRDFISTGSKMQTASLHSYSKIPTIWASGC